MEKNPNTSLSMHIAADAATLREVSSSAGGFWSAYGASSALDNALFPSVTWKSEALEVDITITPKHH